MDVNIVAALVGAGAAAVAVPIVNIVGRKLSGNQYMTKAAHKALLEQHEKERQLRQDQADKDCKAKHDMLEKSCSECKAVTKTVQQSQDESKNEMAKLRKLLIIIAMHNKVPTEKLEEFL